MKALMIISTAGFIVFTGLGATQAQQPNPVQGTPGSLFPFAAPHEVQIINGVPCRTVYDRQMRIRVPVQCAGGVPVRRVDVGTTGSTGPAARGGVPIAGTPGSLFPYAAPHEIRMINGVPCRTIYDRQSKTRVPVACAGDIAVPGVR